MWLVIAPEGMSKRGAASTTQPFQVRSLCESPMPDTRCMLVHLHYNLCFPSDFLVFFALFIFLVFPLPY